MIEPVGPLAAARDRSRFAAARLQRKLTAFEVARRAGLSVDQVQWLEESRVYRFPSPEDALAAAVVYATALGIDHREARALAGLPPSPGALEGNPRSRMAAVAGVGVALAALAGALTLPGSIGGDAERREGTPVALSPALPPEWEVSVRVLNGAGDINWTRQVASSIGALAYQVAHVGRADRFDYTQTAVYYPPGGDQLAIRLARQIGAVTKPLPGGENPQELVVVVGPRKGPGL